MNRLASLFLLACCATMVAHAGGFADTDGLLIEYDFRSDGPINNDPTPLVRVFGDGRLAVAIPWFRKDRGFYEGQLAPEELAELLGDIEASRVPDLDPVAVAREKSATQSSEQTLIIRSETEITRFAFALAGAKTMRESTWRQLRLDAERYGKQVEELAGLWRVDRRLHELTQHDSLTKVAEMPIAGRVHP
jgi:hypothetical protein